MFDECIYFHEMGDFPRCSDVVILNCEHHGDIQYWRGASEASEPRPAAALEIISTRLRCSAASLASHRAD